MRIPIKLTLLCLVSLSATFAFGQKADTANTRKIKSLGGVVVTEKDGELVAVDFRKCGDSWVDAFPQLLEISTIQSVFMTGSKATHERILALAALPNLKALRLDLSSATDESVAAISNFAKLEELNLDGCSISDAALSSIAGSLSIKRLRLAKTKISDTGLAQIKALAQLELLDISDCAQVTSAGLVHLQGLTKLRNLSLGGPGITDAGMPSLRNLTNMVAISLKECSITDASFGALAGMTKLKEFDIYKTPAGDNALRVLSQGREMAKLKLRASGVTKQGLIDHIAKFESVSSIDLGETETDDKALAAISKMKKLEDLNLLRTKVTNAGVASLTSLKLKRLNLDDIQAIDDGVVLHLAKMQSLEFLHLGKTSITDAGIGGLGSLANLKDLILNNTQVSETAVTELQAKLPKLKVLR
jgi:Leucine-rich repeat (LRR) protein